MFLFIIAGTEKPASCRYLEGGGGPRGCMIPTYVLNAGDGLLFTGPKEVEMGKMGFGVERRCVLPGDDAQSLRVTLPGCLETLNRNRADIFVTLLHLCVLLHLGIFILALVVPILLSVILILVIRSLEVLLVVFVILVVTDENSIWLNALGNVPICLFNHSLLGWSGGGSLSRGLLKQDLLGRDLLDDFGDLGHLSHGRRGSGQDQLNRS
jgi:hypothetical protein